MSKEIDKRNNQRPVFPRSPLVSLVTALDIPDEEFSSIMDNLEAHNRLPQPGDEEEMTKEFGKLLLSGERRPSIAEVQREFKVGFTIATHVIDRLVELGVISAEDGIKPRQVLITNPEEYEKLWEK